MPYFDNASWTSFQNAIGYFVASAVLPGIAAGKAQCVGKVGSIALVYPPAAVGSAAANFSCSGSATATQSVKALAQGTLQCVGVSTGSGGVAAGAGGLIQCFGTSTAVTQGGPVPIIYEDFSTYISTADMLADPRGLFYFSEDTQCAFTTDPNLLANGDGIRQSYFYTKWNQAVLDTTKGVAPSTQSMRYDYFDRTPDPNRCANGGMGRTMRLPNLNRLWVDVWFSFSPNWTTLSPPLWACGNVSVLKFLLSYWDVFVDNGRWDVDMLMDDNYWIANNVNPFTNPGGPQIFRDGLPHRLRTEWKLSSAPGVLDSITRIWIDNALSYEIVTERAGANFTQYLRLGATVNEGQPVNVSMWWHKIIVYNQDPGWLGVGKPTANATIQCSGASTGSTTAVAGIANGSAQCTGNSSNASQSINAFGDCNIIGSSTASPAGIANGVLNCVGSVPVRVVTDLFNRADENPLAAPWVNRSGANQIISNIVYSTQAGPGNLSEYGGSWSGNHESQVTLNAVLVGSDNFTSSGPTVRSQPLVGGNYAYYLSCTDSGSQIYLHGGGDIMTAVGASDATIFAVNDVAKLKIVGSTLTVYKNGVSLYTRTDSTLTGGAPGFNNARGTNTISAWRGAEV